MAYRIVEGDDLRTSFSFAPEVRINTIENGPTQVELMFPCGDPAYLDARSRPFMRLVFDRVVAYSWDEFEYQRVQSNPTDVEFRLIEIIDSTIVAELRASGRRIPSDIRHYRICFDDHGTYDLVSTDLQITKLLRGQQDAVG